MNEHLKHYRIMKSVMTFNKQTCLWIGIYLVLSIPFSLIKVTENLRTFSDLELFKSALIFFEMHFIAIIILRWIDYVYELHLTENKPEDEL